MPSHYPNGLYQHPFDTDFNNAQRQYHQGQLPQLQISTPEQPQSWNHSQQPQSVQGTRMHSPAASTHNTRNTPDTLTPDRTFYHQQILSQANSRTSFNQQNDPSMLSPTYVSPPFNPNAREDPWSLINLRNIENGRTRCPSRQSNADFPQYPHVGSDIDSNAVPSDSGYISLSTSQSVLGNEGDRTAPSHSLDFLDQFGNMNVESVAGSVKAASCVASDQISHVGSTRSRKSTYRQIRCDHPGCKEKFKCTSEYKKHKRKHDKPYKCPEPGCKRSFEGFTTTNDLDRHRKSVHQVDVHNNSYKCVGKNCRNKEKIWPRLDNFKQHVERMHPKEDMADVIERSKLNSEKQPSFAGDESAVAHMGASLDLDSMEKPLPSYPAMASSSPLEPPVKRDQQNCSSLDWNSDAIKEEHQRPRFPDETSFATQSAHRQEQHYAQRPAPGLSLANQAQIPTPSDVSIGSHPRKSVSEAPLSNMDYGLSNAPQTKAEQQRMARQRSTAMPSPTDHPNLDNILSMLQQANGPTKRDNESAGKVRPGLSTSSDSDTVVLSKRDALEIMRFLEAVRAERAWTSREMVPRQRICPHSDCGYTFTRACDMRKHMKRHVKPYGCTYPKCFKRFGAKSDWKRHENSQHYQPEAFRCTFETSPGAVCGILSHRLEMFEIHLNEHNILSSQVAQDLAKRSKIGKNCQETFWCGLCKDIIQLKTRRNAAWDERFDHIAHHLEKEKKSIEEWVCLEQNRTKRELDEERKKDAIAAGDDKDKDDESESIVDDEDGDESLPQPPALPSLTAPATWPSIPPQSFSQGRSRKREAPSGADHTDREDRQKRRRAVITTYCCSCHNGPCGAMQVSCLDCGHTLCSNCSTFREEFLMADTMELYE